MSFHVHVHRKVVHYARIFKQMAPWHVCVVLVLLSVFVHEECCAETADERGDHVTMPPPLNYSQCLVV